MYNGNIIIVFEGLDGSGKTTQCNYLTEWLSNNNYKYVYNKARVKPTPEYKIICDIEANNRFFTKELKAALIAYERCKQIYNSLGANSGKIMIFDKYIYSTKSYLEYKNINPEMAEMMLSWLPKPDFVLYFDIGVSECLSRIYKRNTIIGNNENPVFLSKLKTELPRRIINNGVKMIILDASQDEKQIKSEMLNAIIENINLANYKEM